MPARKAYHHGDLKRALVETSIELLRTEGMEALSVAEAGRRLGVSSAAPYRHFKDRKELFRAIAAEGNRLLTAAILKEIGDEKDPEAAFALAGVGYVVWAAENPELYRVTFDPNNIEFGGASAEGTEPPPESLESMADFWPSLAPCLNGKRPLSPEDPIIVELAGRALAHGLASLFVNGVFASLGISPGVARRVARATMGLSPQKAASKRRPTPRKTGRKKKATPDC